MVLATLFVVMEPHCGEFDERVDWEGFRIWLEKNIDARLSMIVFFMRSIC